MKKKRTKLEKLKINISKTCRRIYWFFYTKILYIYYSIKFFLYKKDLKKFKISLLLPTRERSKKFQRMLNSLITTCYDIERIELLLLVDHDDKELNNYKTIIDNDRYKNLSIKIFIENIDTHAKRNNFLANHSNKEILFPINDDMIFQSKNWDIEIDKLFSKVNDIPFCVWIDAGQKSIYLHCEFPIINNIWYKRLGYVASEYFKFWYLDTWICDLSYKSKRFFITKKIKVYQYSAYLIKEEIDNTTLKNIENNNAKKDFQTWHNTEEYRIKDAKLLK